MTHILKKKDFMTIIKIITFIYPTCMALRNSSQAQTAHPHDAYYTQKNKK